MQPMRADGAHPDGARSVVDELLPEEHAAILIRCLSEHLPALGAWVHSGRVASVEWSVRSDGVADDEEAVMMSGSSCCLPAMSR